MNYYLGEDLPPEPQGIWDQGPLKINARSYQHKFGSGEWSDANKRWFISPVFTGEPKEDFPPKNLTKLTLNQIENEKKLNGTARPYAPFEQVPDVQRPWDGSGNQMRVEVKNCYDYLPYENWINAFNVCDDPLELVSLILKSPLYGIDQRYMYVVVPEFDAKWRALTNYEALARALNIVNIASSVTDLKALNSALEVLAKAGQKLRVLMNTPREATVNAISGGSFGFTGVTQRDKASGAGVATIPKTLKLELNQDLKAKMLAILTEQESLNKASLQKLGGAVATHATKDAGFVPTARMSDPLSNPFLFFDANASKIQGSPVFVNTGVSLNAKANMMDQVIIPKDFTFSNKSMTQGGELATFYSQKNYSGGGGSGNNDKPIGLLPILGVLAVVAVGIKQML